MDYNFGMGIMPYMPTNNMWASPYAMNPMLMNAMMFNPALQFPQVPTAPQFSLSQPTAQQGPTVEAAKAQAQQPQTPEFNLHDVANAGDVMPVAMQSAEKRATQYRRSEEFGKLVQKYAPAEQTAELRQMQKEISELSKEITKLSSTKGGKVRAKALARKKSKLELAYNKQAKTANKLILKNTKQLIKNAKLERSFYTKFLKLTEKGDRAGLEKLCNNPKYAGFWKNLKSQKIDVRSNFAIHKINKNTALINNTNKAITGGSAAKWAGRAGWAVAIGLEGYEVYKVADKHGWASKQTAKKTTTAAAGLAGAWAGAKGGAAIGGAIGAWFGGVGAPIGAFIGGLIGGAVGYWGAQKAADATFDATMGKTEYKA